jgi:hypothetical protein
MKLDTELTLENFVFSLRSWPTPEGGEVTAISIYTLTGTAPGYTVCIDSKYYDQFRQWIANATPSS